MYILSNFRVCYVISFVHIDILSNKHFKPGQNIDFEMSGQIVDMDF